MTFKRGDIVTIARDEEWAQRCESKDFAESLRARRYVIVEQASDGFRFATPHGEARREPSWKVWRVGCTACAEPDVVRESDITPTGETATEVTNVQ